ncbi:MAG: hypothetical protein KIT18_03705 [Burkholderiales bacterium]|nr:hypothetical protein [Burkholderiales bacterium]
MTYLQRATLLTCQIRRVACHAVTAPQRMGDVFAEVPTQGVDAVIASYRSLTWPPRGMTPAQIAHWDSVLGKLTLTEDQRDPKTQYMPSDQAKDGLRGTAIVMIHVELGCKE